MISMHWIKSLVKHDKKKPFRLDQGLYDVMMKQKKGTQPRLAVPLLLPALPVLMPPKHPHNVAFLRSPDTSEFRLSVWGWRF